MAKLNHFLLSVALIQLFHNVQAQVGVDPKVKWLVEWNMDLREYRNMKRNSSSNFYFNPDTLTINGVSMPSKKMHTRGNTTLLYWRKSYTVSLKDRFPFSWEGDKRLLKKMYLLSMSMDRYYYRNRLAFECFQDLGLFPLFYHYTEVRINGQSEGLYLAVERPADYALNALGSKAILRRGSSTVISKENFAKDMPRTERKKCIMAFRSIARACAKLKGQQLYQELDSLLDLNAYFSWLAVNYLINNGDYTDELFYYVLPETESVRFGIIPWDFDDIFASQPHEGRAVRDEYLSTEMIFSSEDPLDRAIAKDAYLYQRYLEQANKVLDILTLDRLRSIFEGIQVELQPYFLDPEILRLSEKDVEKAKGMDGLMKKMQTTSDYLVYRYSHMRKKIREEML